MILVDSSVWISYFTGEETRQSELLDGLLSEKPIIVGDLILSEVLRGFGKDKDFVRAKRFFETLEMYEICGFEIALKAAVNFRTLRKRGITVGKTVDVIIGTYCIENNIPLLHDDKDFGPMEKELGLQTL